MSTQQPTARAARAWWVASIAGMASYIDAAAIVSSGIAFVLYQHSIGLTEGEIGGLSAMLTLGVALGALFGGRLGDRFGRRAVFLLTMAMIVVGSGLLVVASGFVPLLIGIALVGIGTGADLPVSLATIAEAAEDHNRGKLVGFSQILWMVGILTTMGISAVVGGQGQFGGQILFGHVGVVAAIVLLLRLTVPESPAWQAARTEGRAGVHTLSAEVSGIRDLVKNRGYLLSLLALLVFYTLTNLGANTGGQFGAYVAVNIIGIDVQVFSLIGLLSLPVGIALGFWFMRIVDGPHRMTYYLIGSIAFIISFAAPAIFGFSLTTYFLTLAGAAIGGAFAFEAIMKVWSQESFPTLLRASAQGAIIAVARFAAAGFALVTPALLATPQLTYGLLAATVAVGLLAGWLGFNRRTVSVFDVESGKVEDGEAAMTSANQHAD
ncbi:Inositol transporter-like SP family MFS transporter [Arthrobacter sp. 9AX]|uniref:MFS transporter n=1 Tax=Arthrobacter sp. 9AX TaxID=2653131 RepID=UPI0012F1DEF8|nr:MFS transporter [Arthrobacter sp. 9AX]VXC24114.1 Inositol transporter-like SP family MFS transporter [Arthrobacter sp. 9AX]